ncbi:MAG TPA: hypothetical protein VMT20_21990 [Terriglobia bacterium]|nr:hypothetical protein [Terriglobia bacterium]
MTTRKAYLAVLVPTLALAQSALAGAETAAFDLVGPRIEVRVTRAGKSRPISQVPNLQPDDRLWIHPDLPAGAGVHYLLVAGFLRGSTNPPPENWFVRADTWSKQVREEGIEVTVPADAQQTILFLAPETGGDFATLRNAVRGRPGAFVRASQDLIQAGLDRTRLDEYLKAVRQTSETDPKDLKARSAFLARSLNIKVNAECFDKPPEQQELCLTQNTDQLVLNDGHSQSMVAALTSGPSADLIAALSVVPAAGGGAYSPYVGAFVDMARLMNNLHTAAYQYIPVLALPKQDELNLRLNNPPSFHNPKSVLVVALPAVEAAQLPPLRAVDPNDIYCLQKSPLVLPVEGAPLVFSTELAHDFTLHLQNKAGLGMDLPARGDAAKGGFVIDTHALKGDDIGADTTGTLRGYWGFSTFDGPTFSLRSAQSAKWAVPAADQEALIVGRQNTLQILSPSSDACCVEDVTLKDQRGADLKLSWKALKPDELQIEVPLKGAKAGAATLLVKQFGVAHADQVPLHKYSEAASLEKFAFHADDPEGVLTGTRLDEVSSLDLKGVHFVPAGLSRVDQKDQLRLSASDASAAAALAAGDQIPAHVALKDGRSLELQTTVEPPRPKVVLLSKSTQSDASAPSAIRLKNQDELPQDARLVFVLKSQVPPAFARNEKIEVATGDNSSSVTLTLADGSLTLQDPATVLAVLDPLKSLGPSVFGPLRFRAVTADGGNGEWQSLTTLVRLPSLKEVRCPASPDKQCTLSGTNLFLIDSVASDAQFTHTVPVPLGFVNPTLNVPRPNGTLLYLKLRDDPSVVNMAVLPVLPDQQ